MTDEVISLTLVQNVYGELKPMFIKYVFLLLLVLRALLLH